jgi:hypothetical protein
MARDLPARRTVFNGRKPVKTGRDIRGRFMVGAPPGPGRPRNPYARAQAALRCAVLEAVTAGDLRAVVRALVRLGKRGNVVAAEVLFKHVIGPPPVPTHPDFLAVHELEARRALPTLVDELALADRPGEQELAEADPDEAPAAEDEALPPAPLHPQLQAMLSWAVEQLAEAQPRAAIPPPNPQGSWEAFAASYLEWQESAAAPIDLVFVSYARWAASRGEPVLAEDRVLAWLTARGATVRTGAYSQLTTVQGVRVTE